ncbi:MAG: ABC transporter ATP-binding protein [Patescibacteria group bacterium]
MIDTSNQKAKNLGDYIQILRTVFNSMNLALKASFWPSFFLIVSRFLNSLVPVFEILVSKSIIDEVINLAQNKEGLSSYLISLLLLALVLVTFQNVLISIEFFTHSRLWAELAKYAQIQFMKQSLRLDMEHFENPEFYNKFEKARKSIDVYLPSAFFDAVDLFGLVVTFISVSVILIEINYLLLPVIVIINLPILVWGMGYSMVTHDLSNSLIPEGRKAAYLADLVSYKQSIKEVKLFNLGGYFLGKYETFLNKVIYETSKIAKRQFSGAFMTTFVSDLAYYSFYFWVILKTIAGKLTIGDLTLYIQSFGKTSETLKRMLRYFNNLYRSALYIDDFNAFIRLKPKILTKEGALELKSIDSIKFENVSFKYREELPYILKDVSFEIKENENVALVGQNGAGKTTLIKLMMRLYEVSSGSILINGVDIKEYTLDSLWRSMGTVFQDFLQYYLTARENIAFGQIEKLENMEEIKKAAEKSGVNIFIETLQDKYESILGTWFENGIDVSGGQWQKIALSRAFIRDCSLLILDEPTAALDAKAEYEIFKRFRELVEGKITILISHRFSTVRLANKILVLEDGGITESGSHKELLELNGRYAELFNLQAEGYK